MSFGTDDILKKLERDRATAVNVANAKQVELEKVRRYAAELEADIVMLTGSKGAVALADSLIAWTKKNMEGDPPPAQAGASSPDIPSPAQAGEMPPEVPSETPPEEPQKTTQRRRSRKGQSERTEARVPSGRRD